MTDDEKFMKEALKQAKKAYAIDEVPIGCVIVQNGKIIARGYNRRNIDKNTLAHAELSAIRKASKKTGDWRLEDCDLYVTLEPCHQVEITRGVLEETCSSMLSAFFRELRQRKKKPAKSE